jgi:hypothetical protein
MKGISRSFPAGGGGGGSPFFDVSAVSVGKATGSGVWPLATGANTAGATIHSISAWDNTSSSVAVPTIRFGTTSAASLYFTLAAASPAPTFFPSVWLPDGWGVYMDGALSTYEYSVAYTLETKPDDVEDISGYSITRTSGTFTSGPSGSYVLGMSMFAGAETLKIQNDSSVDQYSWVDDGAGSVSWNAAGRMMFLPAGWKMVSAGTNINFFHKDL